MLQLPFWPKIGVFQLVFFETKTLMLNKKHNWIPGKNKDKKKGFERENKTGDQKETQDWWKTFAIESFDVVSFHETKAKKTEK